MIDFSKNHFELFGLPFGYRIDLALLTERYRELQRVLHPDKYASASDQERRISLQGTARVNEAFATLKDPMQRAKYMLLLKGIDMDANPGTIQDMSFLMEQMSARETLDQAGSAEDPYEVVDDLKKEIRVQLKQLETEIADRFESVDEDAMASCEELVRKMQFLQKLRHDAEALEAELDEAY